MELYKEKILQVLNKYAFRESIAVKEDLLQSCYLAIIEAGNRVDSPAIAYLVARDCIIKELFQKKPPPTDSMTDPSVFRRVENSQIINEDYFLDKDSLLHAMDELDEDENVVIFFREIMSYTRREITRRTGWTPGKIRELEKSGMKKLKEKLVCPSKEH